MTSDLEFQCCYCDQAIQVADPSALRISVMRLYSSDDEGPQELYAHSRCVAEKLAPALSRKVPFDVNVFGTET